MLFVGIVCNVLGLFQWFFDTSLWPLGHKLMVLFGILLITLISNYFYYGDIFPKKLESNRKLSIRITIIVSYLLMVIGFLTFSMYPQLYTIIKGDSSPSPSVVATVTPNITTPSQTDPPTPVSSPVPTLPSETITAASPITPTPFTLIFGKYDEGVGEPESYTKGMVAYYKYDYRTAFPCLRVAAEGGYAPAQYQLGACYHHGTGTKVDEEKAFIWYKLSADQYYPNGYLWTGYCYQYGVGVEQDYTIAEAYYLAAQEAGHPNADNRLGDLYSVMNK